jgi:hypothetical protein
VAVLGSELQTRSKRKAPVPSSKLALKEAQLEAVAFGPKHLAEVNADGFVQGVCVTVGNDDAWSLAKIGCLAEGAQLRFTYLDCCLRPVGDAQWKAELQMYSFLACQTIGRSVISDW